MGAGAAEGFFRGDDLPAFLSDVDGVGVGRCEVEEDGGGVVRAADAGGAERERLARGFAAARFGFEGSDGVADVSGGGEDFVLAVEGVGEPVAEEDGADGEDVLRERRGRDDGAGDAFGGLAGGAVFECVGEDLFGAGWVVGFHFEGVFSIEFYSERTAVGSVGGWKWLRGKEI